MSSSSLDQLMVVELIIDYLSSIPGLEPAAPIVASLARDTLTTTQTIDPKGSCLEVLLARTVTSDILSLLQSKRDSRSWSPSTENSRSRSRSASRSHSRSHTPRAAATPPRSSSSSPASSPASSPPKSKKSSESPARETTLFKEDVDEWSDDSDCGYAAEQAEAVTPYNPAEAAAAEDPDESVDADPLNASIDEISAGVAEVDLVRTVEAQAPEPAPPQQPPPPPPPPQPQPQPQHASYAAAAHSFYPVQEGDVIYDMLSLKVITQRYKTGFEPTKEFPIRLNTLIAGRYQVIEYLGSAAFSKAVQCLDLLTNQLVCIKIIKNNKDFFDQSLDEIKLLQYINASGDPDEHYVVQLYDYFYHKEHLFIVCELLRDNLYEFSKYIRECNEEPYFTLPTLQQITRQVLIGLSFIHRLNLIHCDLKPENILIKSYSRKIVKLIDFGSSCFVTDHLSTYVQSRSYRAPEVILGCEYGPKIDIWSLGCIICELWTGRVLLQNDSIQTLLVRMIGILGRIPKAMMAQGRHVPKFFDRSGRLYERADADAAAAAAAAAAAPHAQDLPPSLPEGGPVPGGYRLLSPKSTSLRHRLHTDDQLFIQFVEKLLTIDPAKRPTAEQCLQLPWLKHTYP